MLEATMPELYGTMNLEQRVLGFMSLVQLVRSIRV